MILVMHWAVKSLRKERLSQATSISLSVDDRKEYRLVRYRCDVPPSSAKKSAAPGSQGSQGSKGSEAQGPLVADGLLGVYKTGASVPENTLEEHDADKSQVMADSISTVIARACQDPEGKSDEDSCSRLKQHVRHFAADQCASARKCGRLLATSDQFPNLVWVSHDPAHQVRIAYQDPLHAMPAVGASLCSRQRQACTYPGYPKLGSVEGPAHGSPGGGSQAPRLAGWRGEGDSFVVVFPTSV